jgi:chorismate mutase
MSTSQKLTQLRKQIDTTDDQIVELLEKRAKLVQEIASLKKANAIALIDPGRESEIMARVTSGSGLPSAALEEVFDAILLLCKKALGRGDSN